MSTTSDIFPQYAGTLYMFGTPNMPFLASLGIGGMVVDNFDFALSSSATISGGAQQAITETASMADPSTFELSTRDQDVNTVQIVQRFIRTSYKAQSGFNKVIGDSSDYGSIYGPQSIDDIHNWNVEAAMKRIYKDLNYTAWNGTYQRATNAGTAAKTRGLNAGITTYVTSTSTSVANLTTTLVNGHFATHADAGFDDSNTVLFMGSALKQKLSALYTLSLQTQPRDRNVGGADVQTLVTDFGTFPIVYDASVPASKIFCINMSQVRNVWCPVPGKGNLFYEEKPEKAAARSGMIYGQWGLDYGAEEVHSVIYCNG